MVKLVGRLSDRCAVAPGRHHHGDEARRRRQTERRQPERELDGLRTELRCVRSCNTASVRPLARSTTEEMSTVLLLHAGIADGRMWEPQVTARGAGFEVLAPDHADSESGRSIRAVLPCAPRSCSTVAAVGASLGDRSARGAASRPRRAAVVIAPGMPGWPWSGETCRLGGRGSGVRAGRPPGAAEASVHLWIDRPRQPGRGRPGCARPWRR
jgi:hypothetical protein